MTDEVTTLFDDLVERHGGAVALGPAGMAIARSAAVLLAGEVDAGAAGSLVKLLELLPVPSSQPPGVRVDPTKLNKWQKEILAEIVSAITDKPYAGRPRAKAADHIARLDTSRLQPDECNQLWHLIARCCQQDWVSPRSFRFHAAIRLANLLDAATTERGVQWVTDVDAVTVIAGALGMLLDNLPNTREAARRKLVPLLATWRESEGVPVAAELLPPLEQVKIIPLPRPSSPGVGLGDIAGIGDGGPLTDTSHWGRW